jgi:two-component system, OmpR family, sensor histidine kinase ChvG
VLDTATRNSSLQLRLRGKIRIAAILLIVSPLLVAWFMGLYEDWSRQRTQREVQSISTMLADQAPRAQGADGDWLDGFARDHRVFIRLLDRRGVEIHRTDPLYGDGRFSRMPWLESLADFFFGPQGAPDLLAYERVLPALDDRAEVRAAMAGTPGETWRKPDAARMFVFYRAIPRPGGDGVFYLSRLSRRSVSALYDLRYQLLKLTLVLVVVALIVSLWVTRHIVGPLGRIQDACRTYLTKGTSAPIALPRRDEIGDLSRDLDELTRRLQDQATHTRQVTADLAHDLKSPLSTIHASADLLRDSERLDDDRRGRIADAIAQAAAHMSRSVQAMLTLARLDESLSTEHRRRVSIGELVSRVCRESRHDPRNVHVRLVVECPVEHAVFGIEERLAQALHNLVDNAVTFCRETVMVRVAAVAGELVISVLDDGPGVSPGNRDKIFTRFFSVRPPDKAPGSGLGLAIVHTVAQAHGGRVELAEGSDLGGACFVLVLALAD